MQAVSLFPTQTASIPISGSEAPAKTISGGFQVLFRAGLNTAKDESKPDNTTPEKPKSQDQPLVVPIDLSSLAVQPVPPPFRFGMPIVVTEATGTSKQTVEAAIIERHAQSEPDKPEPAASAPSTQFVCPGPPPSLPILEIRPPTQAESSPAQQRHPAATSLNRATSVSTETEGTTLVSGAASAAQPKKVAFTMDLTHVVDRSSAPPAALSSAQARPNAVSDSRTPDTEPPAAQAMAPSDVTGNGRQDPNREEKHAPPEPERIMPSKESGALGNAKNTPEFAPATPIETPASAAPAHHTARSEAPAPIEPGASLARPQIAVAGAETTKATPLRELELKVPGHSEQGVDLHIVDEGGKVHVEVRTSDTNLAASLRANVGELVQKLDHAGFRTESLGSHEGLPISTATARGSDPGGEGGRKPSADEQQAPGHGGGQGGQQQQQGHGRGNRPKWLEEIVRNFQPSSTQQENTVNGN